MSPVQIMTSYMRSFDNIEVFSTRRAIGRPKKHLFTKHVKKDALWKPLFRKFRRFLKDYVSTKVNLQDMEELPYEERGNIYCRILQLPQELCQQSRSIHALILIIES
jgi:hypothetical protein